MSELHQPNLPELGLARPLDEAQLRTIIREEVQAALHVAPADEAALLTARETAALIRVDQRTLRRLVAEGSVPAPLRIGRRAIRWSARSLRQSLGLAEPPRHSARVSRS